MSDTATEPAAAPEPPPADVPSSAAPHPAARVWLAVAIALAGALLLVAALVATAPAWAPLLPWGQAAADRGRDQEFAARLDGLRAALREEQRQTGRDAATTAAAQHQIETRLAALEARPAAAPAEIADLHRRLTTLSGAVTDLGSRLAALDKAAHARAANDVTDVALALAVMQIRNAVAVGRPFAASYAALATLARGRPDIASAAAPLAGPATTAVASRAVLAEGLRQLAADLAAGTAATPAPSGWTAAILARLRGLVTIRRVDGGSASGAAAAVDDARQRLAAGDLAGAVAALDKLSGDPAKAALPWLRQAQRRLAVEAALRQVETLAIARLGAAAGGASAGAGSSP